MCVSWGKEMSGHLKSWIKSCLPVGHVSPIPSQRIRERALKQSNKMILCCIQSSVAVWPYDSALTSKQRGSWQFMDWCYVSTLFVFHDLSLVKRSISSLKKSKQTNLHQYNVSLQPWSTFILFCRNVYSGTRLDLCLLGSGLNSIFFWRHISLY